MSYLRQTGDGAFEGKIYKLFRSLTTPSYPASRLVDSQHIEIIVVLYMATEQARAHIRRVADELTRAQGVSVTWHIVVVYPLSAQICIHASDGSPMNALIQDYYDHAVHDEHMRVGGTADSKYGFAACGIPLVLSHNTPNNSIALLWSYEDTAARGLFPRVRRHATSQRGGS